MNDQKNLILTIILCSFVLVGWQYFYERPRTEQIRAQAAIKKTATLNAAPTQDSGLVADRAEAINMSPRIKIDNDKIHGSISLKGLRFDDLEFKNYYTDENNTKQVEFLSPSNTKSSFFAEIGWLSKFKDLKLPDENTVWKANKTELKPGENVVLTWDNGAGLEFKTIIGLDQNYLFSIQQEVKNNTNLQLTVVPYALINQNYVDDHKKFAILHEGPLGVFTGTLTEATYEDLAKDGNKSFKDLEDGWLGITEKYWFAALIPQQNYPFRSNFVYSKVGQFDRYQVDYSAADLELIPGGTASYKASLFAGAKELALLDYYQEELGIKLFDRAVDYGWFYFLTKPMLKFLKLFHDLLGNFGLAILLMTVVVKLILFPLANKSYKSMNAMKRLQPKIEEIRKKMAENKTDMNKAIMQLYAKEKVNPLAGCLPLLIQIPVFFSLYKVLFVSLEMRHAPFFGWIKDLSAPDPTTIFNLFGLIPWSPPSFFMIGAWPILMAITMYFQQRLNPEPADPVQAKVMKFLPFIFLVMFASFPAGLIIYWAWNNLLSIGQQTLLMKRHK